MFFVSSLSFRGAASAPCSPSFCSSGSLFCELVNLVLFPIISLTSQSLFLPNLSIPFPVSLSSEPVWLTVSHTLVRWLLDGHILGDSYPF